jgi:hypothetical protein
MTHLSGPLFVEGGMVGGFQGRPGGRVFYVNSAAASTDGRNLERPWYDVDNAVVFDGLQGAIDKCEHNRGDVIYVARAYKAITTPILFNKRGISVIAQGFGMNPFDMGEYFSFDLTSADAPAAIVSQYCYIYGLGFNTNWVDAGVGASLRVDASVSYPGWGYFDHCRFMNWSGTTIYGINFEAGANYLVEKCTFEGVSGAFQAGIAFGGSPTQNPTHNQVLECRFRDCTYAIEHKDGTPHNFLYKSNVCIDSKLLNSKNAAANGLVADNWLETATDGSSYDTTVAAMKANGINFSGNHYSE